jgi:hypothetical protein
MQNKMKKKNLLKFLLVASLILSSSQTIAHSCNKGVVGNYYQNSDGKGGFVQSSAFVDKTNPNIYIGRNTSVCDTAIVLDGKVFDYAVVKGTSELTGGILRHLSVMSGGSNSGAVLKGKSEQISGHITKGFVFNGEFVYAGQELKSNYNFKSRFTSQQRERLKLKPLLYLEQKLEQSKQAYADQNKKLESEKSILQDKIIALRLLFEQKNLKVQELNTNIKFNKKKKESENQQKKINQGLSELDELLVTMQRTGNKLYGLSMIPDSEKKSVLLKSSFLKLNSLICDKISWLGQIGAKINSSVCISNKEMDIYKQVRKKLEKRITEDKNNFISLVSQDKNFSLHAKMLGFTYSTLSSIDVDDRTCTITDLDSQSLIILISDSVHISNSINTYKVEMESKSTLDGDVTLKIESDGKNNTLEFGKALHQMGEKCIELREMDKELYERAGVPSLTPTQIKIEKLQNEYNQNLGNIMSGRVFAMKSTVGGESCEGQQGCRQYLKRKNAELLIQILHLKDGN